MYKKRKNRPKNIHTQQSSSAYLLHQCCNNYYAEKYIYLFNVTLAEFYRHDCRISKSSLVSLKTNMLHNLFLFYCLFFVDRETW